MDWTKILDFVKQELDKISYGKVTIEKAETSDKIDIITESRKRFSLKEK